MSFKEAADDRIKGGAGHTEAGGDDRLEHNASTNRFMCNTLSYPNYLDILSN